MYQFNKFSVVPACVILPLASLVLFCTDDATLLYADVGMYNSYHSEDVVVINEVNSSCVAILLSPYLPLPLRSLLDLPISSMVMTASLKNRLDGASPSSSFSVSLKVSRGASVLNGSWGTVTCTLALGVSLVRTI